MRRIAKYEFGTLSLPLLEPYELSFTTVTNLNIVWVTIEDDAGNIGIGEAVPLPGYGKETLSSVQNCVAGLGEEYSRLTEDSLRKKCAAVKVRHPFAASAVMTALEFPLFADKAKPLRPISLVYPLSSKLNQNGLANKIKAALKLGYRSFKMKIGNGIEQDIKSMRNASAAFPDAKFTVSFDANQAYSLKEAVLFCQAMEAERSARLTYLEQPLPVENWKEMGALRRSSNIKLMLDESIYNTNDIKRAKEVGCDAVKLKLCKHFGLSNTMKLARKATECGLNVVIGNGVSSDIGNLSEAILISLAPGIFSEPAECNGFLKLPGSIVFKSMGLDKNGCLPWQGNETNLTEQFNKAIRNFKNTVQ